eukprot:TRINITY_DN9262_c0_g1_i3.p1 TRINITY_DN9262_c0_g1~~TRINITY_DN9262_c0_g1_i3.p1  ORF type:complete len:1359 (+),score=415.28 TRINITY_DN9262_c0_g1_i3:120-4079(+)
MAVSVLWTVGDAAGADADEDAAGEDALFQLSQWSTAARPDPDPRVRVDYLGDSLQCQLAVDRYFGAATSADAVYSSVEPHLLGVLRGQPATCFVRLGPRPEQLPLGVLFGDLQQRGKGDTAVLPTDGVAVRVVKRLFEEMQQTVRGGEEAFSVKMGFSCFMNTPTKPTDLLKNVRQHVPPELEWGAAEGVLHAHDAPGKYVYATAAADVLRTLGKLLTSASFRPVAHRLSYALHLIVLRTPAHIAPASAHECQVAHLCFLDVHPDHTAAMQRAVTPVLQQLQKQRRNGAAAAPPSAAGGRGPGRAPSGSRASDAVFDGRFVGSPLSPRGASLMSPGRGSDGVFGRCLSLLTGCGPGSRLVVLATAQSGPHTSAKLVQADAMAAILQAAQQAGPVLPWGVSGGAPPSAPSSVHSPRPSAGTLGGVAMASPPSLPGPPRVSEQRPPDLPRRPGSPPGPRLPPPPPAAAQPQRAAGPPAPAPPPRPESVRNRSVSPPPADQRSRRRREGSDVLEMQCEGLRRECEAKDRRIAQLTAQLAALGSGEASGEGAAVRQLQAESARRDAAAARRELDAERQRRAEDDAAWRLFLSNFEQSWAKRIKDLAAAVSPGADASLAQRRLLGTEVELAAAERRLEESEARGRGLAGELQRAQQQAEGLRQSARELEGRLAAEGAAREAAEREAQRARQSFHTVSAQLEQIRRGQGERGDAGLRAAREESEGLRREIALLSGQLEAEQAVCRELRRGCAAAAVAERERLEAREGAHRERLVGDCMEHFYWLACACVKWAHFSSPGSTSAQAAGRAGDAAALAQRLEAKTREAQGLTEQVAALRTELLDARSSAARELGALQQRARALGRERDGAEAQLLEAEAKARGMRGGGDERAAELREQLRRAREQLHAAQGELEAAERRRAVAEDELGAIRRRERDHELEGLRREQEIARLSADLASREEQVAAQRGEIGRLQAAAEQTAGGSRERHLLEARVADLEASRQRLQQELQAAAQRLSKDSAAAGSLRSQQLQLEELRMQVHLLGAEGENKDRELAVLRAERDQLRADGLLRRSWEQGVQEEIREKAQTLDSIERLLEQEQSRDRLKDEELAQLRARLRTSELEVSQLRQRLARAELDPGAARLPPGPPRREPSPWSEDRAGLRDSRNLSPPLLRAQPSPKRPGEVGLYPGPSPLARLPSPASSDGSSPRAVPRSASTLVPPQAGRRGGPPPADRLRRQRDSELALARLVARLPPEGGGALPPPPPPPPPRALAGAAPPTVLQRAEQQIARLQGDLAAFPTLPGGSSPRRVQADGPAPAFEGPRYTPGPYS